MVRSVKSDILVRFECPECGECFISGPSLKRHMSRLHHPDSFTREEIDTVVDSLLDKS